MDYSIYALRVGSDKEVRLCVAEHLGHEKSPQSIRLATNIPISNQGWPVEAVGTLLRLDDRGALIGADEPEGVPRLLVPWDCIAYLADGIEDV